MPAFSSEAVFRLAPYGSRQRGVDFNYLVITPAGTSTEVVAAAWAYAVRYTAKGLDLPDHDAALEKFSERHPLWKIIQSLVTDIQINLAIAETDVPENQG